MEIKNLIEKLRNGDDTHSTDYLELVALIDMLLNG